MYYVNCYTFLEEPEKDWAKMVQETKQISTEPSLFDQMGLTFGKNKPEVLFQRTSGGIFMLFGVLADSNNL